MSLKRQELAQKRKNVWEPFVDCDIWDRIFISLKRQDLSKKCVNIVNLYILTFAIEWFIVIFVLRDLDLLVDGKNVRCQYLWKGEN